MCVRARARAPGRRVVCEDNYFHQLLARQRPTAPLCRTDGLPGFQLCEQSRRNFCIEIPSLRASNSVGPGEPREGVEGTRVAPNPRQGSGERGLGVGLGVHRADFSWLPVSLRSPNSLQVEYQLLWVPLFGTKMF